MKLENIIELILLLIFFVISPLLQRRRRAGRPASPPTPEQPGSPGWPARPGPARIPDYSAYLSESLKALRRRGLAVRSQLESSRLADLPNLNPLAEALVTRGSERLQAALEMLDRAKTDEDGGMTPVRANELAQLGDQVRVALAHAEAYASVLSTVAEQRRSPRRGARLGRLDGLIGALVAEAQPSTQARRRWAILWPGDPRVPASLLGPGAVGLAALPEASLARACGWSWLGRGIGFDVGAAWPGLIDEVRRAIRFGPLQGRESLAPYYARPAFDMASALGAWAHHLIADAVGALAMGRAYAVGVIHEAMARGVGGQAAAQIRSEDGRYAPEPPLVARLPVIERVLRSAGWTNDVDGLNLLSDRMALPTEAHYVLPNRLTRRLRLEPLIEYMAGVGEVLAGERFDALQDRRLDEIVGSGLSPVLDRRLEVVRRAFSAGEIPSERPELLVSGAILAQGDRPEDGLALANALTQALDQGAMRRRTKKTAPAMSDRQLLRDAIVLAEIL